MKRVADTPCSIIKYCLEKYGFGDQRQAKAMSIELAGRILKAEREKSKSNVR